MEVDMSEDYKAGLFPMDETLCRDCSHRFSRIIQPLDYESWGIDPDVIDDIDPNEDILVEQHTCLITQQDLDGMVRECNRFSDIREQTFFADNPYKR